MFLQNFNDIRDVTVRATGATSVTPKFPDPLNLFHGWGALPLGYISVKWTVARFLPTLFLKTVAMDYLICRMV